jgi:protocatechuate 3,4-dioxygenase beta subunit
MKRRHTRRRILAGTAAGAGTLIVAGVFPEFVLAEAALGENAEALQVPSWNAVPSCTPSNTDRAGQGPFFIHNDERVGDIDLFRQDIRGQYNPQAEPGIELQMHFRVLDNSGGGLCSEAPLAGVAVYVWHCDAQGYYSGFGQPGEQTPDIPYRFRPNHNDLDNDDSFCRGAGLTDANGVVSFRTIFPGWYNGRDIHLHLMILKPDAPSRGRARYRGDGHLYTTQLYFEPELIDRVHKAAQPYLRRTTHSAYHGIILGDERGNSGLRMRAWQQEDYVVSQMQLVLDAAQSTASLTAN